MRSTPDPNPMKLFSVQITVIFTLHVIHWQIYASEAASYAESSFIGMGSVE
jgi:hypothetical protein